MSLTKLDKLTGREKLMLSVAAAVVLVALVNGFVVPSVMKGFSQIDGKIAEARRVLDYNYRVLGRQQAITSEFARISARLGSAPATASGAGINSQIETLAKSAGVDCQSITPREPKSSNSCVEQQVEIARFEADMAGVLTFVHDWEGAAGLQRVVRVSLTPKEGTKLVKGSMLIARVTLSADPFAKSP
jgi:hypothetical protein